MKCRHVVVCFQGAIPGGKQEFLFLVDYGLYQIISLTQWQPFTTSSHKSFNFSSLFYEFKNAFFKVKGFTTLIIMLVINNIEKDHVCVKLVVQNTTLTDVFIHHGNIDGSYWLH